MSIKKPKSTRVRVCVWLRSWRVCVCVCESTRLWIQCADGSVCFAALLFVCKSSSAPGQGEGLILCGLKRINFVLTLAGCGLHPYPPLFSVPGAKQRRRQASRDGEYKRESYCTRRREREGGGTVSKKCHFRKRLLFSLPHYISILWASVGARALQIYVSCQSLSTQVWPKSPAYAYPSAELIVALFLLGWVNTKFKSDLFTHACYPLPLSVPSALTSVCSIWKNVYSWIVQAHCSQPALSLPHSSAQGSGH